MDAAFGHPADPPIAWPMHRRVHVPVDKEHSFDDAPGATGPGFRPWRPPPQSAGVGQAGPANAACRCRPGRPTNRTVHWAPPDLRGAGKVCIVFRVAPLDVGAEILGLCGRFVPVVSHVPGGCLTRFGLSGGGFMDLLFDGWFGKLAKLPWC